jgi:hypothetical protein
MVAACRDWDVGSTNSAAQPFDNLSSEFSLIGAGATTRLPPAPFRHRSLLAYVRTNIIGREVLVVWSLTDCESGVYFSLLS